MTQNFEILHNRYKQFITRIVQTQRVYALATDKDVAICPSNEYDTLQGQQAVVITYWSEQSQAQACQVQEWEEYQIKQIPLAEFMEDWCIGMAEDGTIAGIEFDTQLVGIEILPIELLKDIIQESFKQGKKIKIRDFGSLIDIQNYIQEVE